MDESWQLQDALAVVIGGSEGIGSAIAEGLAVAGAAPLVLAARDAGRLERARTELARIGKGDVHVETVDVRSPDSVQALCSTVRERYGVPTVLVNSAGVSVTKPAVEVTVEEWDAVHDTQLRGVFFSCQAFGRLMIDQGYGKIINLSSTWAATVGPGRSVYCAAKAGVSQLTAALAAEWAPSGVRVNAIAPTATRSPGLQRRLDEDPEREEYLRARIPLGRLAEPEDMTGAAVFLASRASDFVTGHTLFVDGGWRFAK